MSEETRSYRKNLSTTGQLYLAEKEWDIMVKNVSVSGMMASIIDNTVMCNIKDVFEAIHDSAVVDFFVPEINISGDGNIVRAEMIDQHIHLGVEFRNISYHVDQQFYFRRSYRKNMTASGQIIFNEKKYKFETQNVSVDGLMIRIKDRFQVEEGTITLFDFKHLHIRGRIEVIWVQYDADPDQGMTLGLQYLKLEKDEIKGVPSFIQKPD